MIITVSYIPYSHGLAIIIPRWLTYILSDKTALKIKRFGVNVLGFAPPSLSDMDGANGKLVGFTTLSPAYVEERYSGCHYNSLV